MSNPIKLTPNKNIPAIQQPTNDLRSVALAVTNMKSGVESLAGVRGGVITRAVTFQDLVDLGLITVTQGLASAVTSTGGGGA